tara:strand:- start:47 stop:229 length:183 start_codon:yes stop_codon:yes gene_type:complete
MEANDLTPSNINSPKKNLEEMSIDALKAYIEALKEEINRTENAIAQKKLARNGANSFFKS